MASFLLEGEGQRIRSSDFYLLVNAGLIFQRRCPPPCVDTGEQKIENAEEVRTSSLSQKNLEPPPYLVRIWYFAKWKLCRVCRYQPGAEHVSFLMHTISKKTIFGESETYLQFERRLKWSPTLGPHFPAPLPTASLHMWLSDGLSQSSSHFFVKLSVTELAFSPYLHRV